MDSPGRDDSRITADLFHSSFQLYRLCEMDSVEFQNLIQGDIDVLIFWLHSDDASVQRQNQDKESSVLDPKIVFFGRFSNLVRRPRAEVKHMTVAELLGAPSVRVGFNA
jgi:hypothetical protein